MPLSENQQNILIRLASQKGQGCNVTTLVNTFKAGGTSVEQMGCNYTFTYKEQEPLTVVFGNERTPAMSKMPKELADLSKQTLFDNIPDFHPNQLA